MFSRKIRVYRRDPDAESDVSSRKISVVSTRDRGEKDKARKPDSGLENRHSDRTLLKPSSHDSRPSSSRRHHTPQPLGYSEDPQSSTSPVLPGPPGAVRPDITRAASSTYPEASTRRATPKLMSSQEASRSRNSAPFTPDPTDVCNPAVKGIPARISKTPAPPSPPLTESGDPLRESSRSNPHEPSSRDRETSRHHRSASSKLSKKYEEERLRTSKSSLKSSRDSRERRHTTDPSRSSKVSRSSKDGSRRRRERDDGDSAPRSSGNSSPRNGRSTPLPGIAPLTTAFAHATLDPQSRNGHYPAISSQMNPHHYNPHSHSHPAAQPYPAENMPYPTDKFVNHHSMGSPSYPFRDPSIPPPPPPLVTPEPPRVDYLLRNGGLPRPVTRNMLDIAPNVTTVPNNEVATAFDARTKAIFAPFTSLLNDYTNVMKKNGSLAVASGYRSVARRLLDRLEAVFARNISSEFCQCIMCHRSAAAIGRTPELGTGMNWGEILEYVAGRRDLPQWPSFTIASTAVDLESTVGSREAPMQKLDIDVPDAYRSHYIKQSQKTKQAVQSWLLTQPEEPSSPPLELDDDTVTFAIATHLDPRMRQLYFSMMPERPTAQQEDDDNNKAEADKPDNAADPVDPNNEMKKEVLSKSKLAIQRLYRLERPPRESECALYLVKNPDIHCVIATLAAVSEHEWDILISGRFDGFLWSGAEPHSFVRPSISRPGSARPGSASTMPTPYDTPVGYSPVGSGLGQMPFGGSIPRSDTSSPHGLQGGGGAPVSLDEENEIAALADIERNIFSCMESIEKAFELLHNQAEDVRRILVERSAGLLLQSQIRRGQLYGPEIHGLSPLHGLNGLGEGGPSDGTSGLDSLTELGPEDSVSNISSYRRRRRKEKTTRSRRPEGIPEE